MGSLPQVNGAGTWPVTKLPLFNTTTQSSDIRSYHECTAYAVPIVTGAASLQQRFARFIAAIVGDDDNVGFLAEAGSERALVIYTAAVSPDGVVSKEMLQGDADSVPDDLGFGLYIRNASPDGTETTQGSHRVPQAQRPLVLEIVLGSEQGVADVTLRIRGDHGPPAASQHLLNLAIAHMSPKGELANVQASRIGSPAVLLPSSKNHNGDKSTPGVLHAILEEAARSCRQDIAIDEVTGRLETAYSRRSLTYSELNAQAGRWANQMASILQKLNWPAFRGEQRMVPIYLPNCTELSICMNGIARAGHCFCILPMEAPMERLRDLLDDLCAPGILGVGPNPWSGSQFGDEITWIDFLDPMSCLAGAASLSSEQLPVPVLRAAHPDDVAYIIYTSGSTGRPKGVVMLHCTATAFLRDFDHGPGSLPTGQGLRWMVMSSPTFDIMLMDHFMPLLKGGTVVMAERSLLLSSPETVVTELRATATFTVTSLAMLLRPERVPTLNTIIVGGELVGQRVLDNFAPRKDGEPSRRRLFGGYGPTETTIFASVEEYTSGSRPSVVGAPLPGLQYVILDMKTDSSARRGVAPLGVVGELAIGGPQVSPGYLKRPEETALAFVDDPRFGRLYRTGDKARAVWSEQGEPVIDFLGRINADQVKLNGRRVELPEIENVLSRAGNVARVAVFVSESQLVACVMPWEGSCRDNAALEAQCRAEATRYLPAWMHPVHYSVMEAFPRTVSGKVDRLALQGMLFEKTHAYVKPSNTPVTKHPRHESIVYEGLAAALGERIWMHTTSASLVSLGIDSLRALVFIQRLEDLGVNHFDIGQVLSARTINDLVAAVESQHVEHVPVASKDMSVLQEQHGVGTSSKSVKMPADETPKSTIVPNGASGVAHTDSGFGDQVDVSILPADSDEVFELSVEAKLRHFDHHCRVPCLAALGLLDDQVEQVLPVTNVQTRFVAAAVDPSIYDRKRYIGRPNVTHFPYLVPEDMDPARLQRAVETVLPRYDCFRTVFVRVAHPIAPFAQCTLSPSAAVIPKLEVVCDHRCSDANDPTGLWQQAINGVQRTAEAAMSIDRLGITVSWVWSRNRAQCVFVLSLFHGVYDGTQLIYLMDAIATEYACPGSAPPVHLLPIRTAVELGLSYDWVSTVIYWARRLGGVPGFRIASRQPIPTSVLPDSRPGLDETHMRTLSVKSIMTMRRLDQAAVDMSTTMLTVVEAAWASVLAQTLPRETIAKEAFNIQFGTIMNGRRHHDALRCMAPMLAALPVLLDFPDAGARLRTNRETCALLATQRAEAEPYLQMPCPTVAHAKMGTDRIDSVLLVQALQHDVPSSRRATRGLPGYNVEENLLPAYKEIDTGMPIVMEVWPGRGRWDEEMLLRCAYNVLRPGYEFLNRDWVLTIMSALDEAMTRITTEPDAPFYVG